MNDLDEIKKRLEFDIEDLSRQLGRKKQELKKYKKKKKVTNEEILKSPEKYYRHSINEQEYIRDLGGDGRSLPSESLERGKVLIIEWNEEFFIHPCFKKKLIELFEACFMFDHLEQKEIKF